MADPVNIKKSIDPATDGSGGWSIPPAIDYGMNFKDYGSYGLRQYSGWVREEFLPQLSGRQAMTVYREMLDNSSTVGSMVFAITQAMRKVTWRLETPRDGAEADAGTQFLTECKDDMSHTWEDFIAEALSMLGYGFSAHEIVYKMRMGDNPPGDWATSQYSDGKIGWRRLPIRGQDTVLKWFFDDNGQVRGLTQQPWVGTLIDLPIEKLLLFRPTMHKNNPEGRSVLRTAYRSFYFVKRLEELESILFERMGGFPVMYVPSELMSAATGATPDPKAIAALTMYKKLVTNMRVDEQMGAVLPSDTYTDAEGKPSAVKMYSLELLTPASGSRSQPIDRTIARHKLDMLMSLLCDFIMMGHEIRGTNNLGTMKVDMFYQAIQGWLTNIAEVMNRYAIPRLWKINGMDRNTMPRLKPDMPARMDLDGLGGFVENLAAAGMPIFPDEELEDYLREAAGLPTISETSHAEAVSITAQPEVLKRVLKAAMAKRIKQMRATGEAA
jgi:hypothetical protein